ncbi:MAG: ROK family protein [Arachnia propionica]|uniref:ROK family protein n=1 Tax=Arachnia propionica TaxID=1750 RepID=UPI0026F8B70F|nr:ROK family protein [Arachnia propionica]
MSSLMKVTQLSRPTVTGLLEVLRDQELVHSLGAEGGVGRPAEVWATAPSAGVVIGVDLLHSSLLAATAQLDGTVTGVDLRQDVSLDARQRLDLLIEVINQQIARHQPSPVHAIVISTTGTVDPEGCIKRSDAVQEWESFPLGARLTERLGLPVRVENDVNAAAFGEFAIRCSDHSLTSSADLLFIGLSRGIVTGLVLGGQLHRGSHHDAGEVGLVITEDETLFPGQLRRAAETIGAVSAVLDPATIVVALTHGEIPGALDEIRTHLATLRSSSAAALNLEVPRLGQASATVGALTLALQDARQKLLGHLTARIPCPSNLTLLTHVTAKGSHVPMPSSATTQHRPELRIGVVGVGARSDIAKHFELPGRNCRITAVADPHPNASQRILDRLGRDDIALTRSVTELIGTGIDAALVTSPDDTHATVTCELLRAGVPVYLEKPMAIHTADAIEILTTAHETGTKLYVGHNMRHMNVVRSMRDLIRKGEIGEVKAIWCRHFVGHGGDYYFKDWHATREHGTGLLLQKAAHDLDVMHWLADSHTTRVTAMGGLTLYDRVTDRRDHSDQLMWEWFSMDNWPPLSQQGLNPVIDVEDLSMMLMQMESGVFASYQQCHYTPDYWRNYTVIGTEGRIENFGDYEGGHIKLWRHRSDYDPDGDATYPITGDAGGHGDADVLTTGEFIDFVTDGTPTDTSPLGAYHAVAAAIAATDSLRDGSTPRDVPTLDPEVVQYFENNQVK